MRATIPIDLTDKLLDDIAEIGRKRMPAEACGVLLPKAWRGRQVWEMPNRSMEPQTSFAFKSSDIMVELEGWVANNPEDWDNIVIWHTHPRGGIGPSREDMRGKLPKVGHLVVSLTESGPVPTWY